MDYILNGINYQTLIMMLADAPRYMRRRNGSTGKVIGTDEFDEASQIVNVFYQSKLKR